MRSQRFCVRKSMLFAAVLALSLAGCMSGDDDESGGVMGGDGNIPVLGGGTHSIGGVTLTQISVPSDNLDVPRDLAFNPDTGDLWVINTDDSAMVIYSDVGTSAQDSNREAGVNNTHFFAKPSSLAFGQTGTLATCHETDQPTQGSLTPDDFMGPTLWTSDPDTYDAGFYGHIDMLHNSPLSMGIAWGGEGNVYWLFDGYHSSITRYDFHADHGPGETDHSDGEVSRYVQDEVKRVADVPSHMEFDADTDLLYIADTGNNRIAVLDTTTGSKGSNISPNYDYGQQYHMDDATMTTLVSGASAGMSEPSGLAIRDGVIFVSDNASSKIFGFDLQGNLIDWLDTGLPTGTLMGIAFDDAGDLYLVDPLEDAVLKISSK